MAVHAKERLLMSAIALGRRDGWSHLSVADVLAESGAARRSFYTHFPGGTKELTVAAVELAATWITAVVKQAAEQHSSAALTTFVDHWRHVLTDSDFEQGCPVAAAAASRPHHAEAADIAAASFEAWESLIAAALVRDGADAATAKRLASLIVTCIEGAVTRCIADRSCAPMDVVHDHLQSVLAAELP